MKAIPISIFGFRISKFLFLSFAAFLLTNTVCIAQEKFVVQDSTKAGRNLYGDLLEDDKVYNKVYPIWKPAIEVIAINNATWMIDRYILNYDWARVSEKTWRSNLRGQMEWDDDRFGINFLGHPYSGTMYFNAARSQGYTFLQSIPFAIEGSLMWEYFGEITRPSYNDIINTPVNGVFFGEILYRLSSNILDDRTRGRERTWREIAAGIVNPIRGINRMLQGKTWSVTRQEVYKKEPVNITFNGGINNHNENDGFFSGKTRPVFSVQFDYGNPFEERVRKPFDLFRFRVGLRLFDGRKILDQATGYGILFGRNKIKENPSMLLGAFQYYDYWDNNSFELAAIGLGPGTLMRTKMPWIKKSNLFLGFHIGAVPLAGTSESPDTTSQARDYNFGSGLAGKMEATANIGTRLTARIVATYYYIRQHVHGRSDSYISTLQPNIAFRLFNDLHIGYEQAIYNNARYFHPGTKPQHFRSREQKLYLQFYFEDRHRRGKYH
jgi:hypothetical protein